eukprot:2921066-Rhodomonas_salina.4
MLCGFQDWHRDLGNHSTLFSSNAGFAATSAPKVHRGSPRDYGRSISLHARYAVPGTCIAYAVLVLPRAMRCPVLPYLHITRRYAMSGTALACVDATSGTETDCFLGPVLPDAVGHLGDDVFNASRSACNLVLHPELKDQQPPFQYTTSSVQLSRTLDSFRVRCPVLP